MADARAARAEAGRAMLAARQKKKKKKKKKKSAQPSSDQSPEQSSEQSPEQSPEPPTTSEPVAGVETGTAGSAVDASATAITVPMTTVTDDHSVATEDGAGAWTADPDDFFRNLAGIAQLPADGFPRADLLENCPSDTMSEASSRRASPALPTSEPSAHALELERLRKVLEEKVNTKQFAIDDVDRELWEAKERYQAAVVRELDVQLQSARTKLEARTKDSERYRSERNALRAQVAAAARTPPAGVDQTTVATLAELQGKLETSQSELKASRAELAATLEATRREHAAAQEAAAAELAVARVKEQGLNTELMNVRAELSAVIQAGHKRKGAGSAALDEAASAAAAAAIVPWKERLAAADAQVNHWQQAVSDRDAAVVRLTEQASAASAAASTSEGKLAEATDALAAARSTHDELETELARAEANVARLTESVSELESRAKLPGATASDDHIDVDAALQEWRNRASTAEELVQELQPRIDEHKSELAAKDAALDTADGVIRDLKSKLEVAESAQQSMVAELASAAKAAKEVEEELRVELAVALKQSDDAPPSAQDVDAAIKPWKERSESAEAQLQLWQQALAERDTALSQMSAKLSATSDKAAELEAALGSATAQLSAQSSESSDKSAAPDGSGGASKSTVATEAELAEARAAEQRLRAELLSAKMSAKQEQEASAARLEQHVAKLAEAEGAAREAAAVLAESQASEKDLRVEFDSLKKTTGQKLAEMASHATQAAATEQVLHAELSALRQEATALRSELVDKTAALEKLRITETELRSEVQARAVALTEADQLTQGHEDEASAFKEQQEKTEAMEPTIRAWRERSEAADVQLQLWQQALAERDTALSQMSAKLSATSDKAAELEAALGSATAQLSAQSSESSDKSAAPDGSGGASKSTVATEAELAEARAAEQRLRAELLSAKMSAKQEQEASAARLEQHVAKLAEAEGAAREAAAVLAESQASEKDLRSELEDIKSTAAAKINSQTELARTLRSELDSKALEIGKLTAVEEQHHTKLEQQRGKLEEAQQTIKRQQIETAELQQIVSTISAAPTLELDASSPVVQEAVRPWKERVAAADQQLLQWQQAVTERDTALTELNEKLANVTAISTELDDARSKSLKDKAHIAELENKIECQVSSSARALKDAEGVLRQQVESAEHRVLQMQKELASAQTVAAKREAMLRSEMAKSETSTAEVVELKAKVEMMVVDLANARKAEQELGKELDQAREAVLHREAQSSNAVAANDLVAKLNAAMAERAQFALQLEETSHKLKEATQGASEANDLLAACRAGMKQQQQQVEQYATERAKLAETNRLLAAELGEARAAQNGGAVTVTERSAEIGELQAAHARTSTQVANRTGSEELVAKLQARAEAAEHALALSKQNAHATAEALEESRDEIRTMLEQQAKSGDSQTSQSAIDKALQPQRARVIALEQQLVQWRDALAERDAALTQQSTRISELSAALNTQGATAVELDALRAVETKLRSELNDVERGHKEREAALNAKVSALEADDAAQTALRVEQLSAAKAAEQEAKYQLAQHATALVEAERLAQQRAAELKLVEEQLRAVESQPSSNEPWKERANAAENRVAELMREVSERDAKLQERLGALASMSTRAATAESRLAEVDGQVQGAPPPTPNRTLEKVRELAAELEVKTAELAAAKRLTEQYEADLKAVRQQLSASTEPRVDESDRLREQGHQQNSSVATVTELARLQRKADAAEVALDSAVAELNSVKSELKDKNEVIWKLEVLSEQRRGSPSKDTTAWPLAETEGLLQVCKAQEDKIIELLSAQKENDGRSIQREKHVTQLERRLSQMIALRQPSGDAAVLGQLKEAEEKVAFIFKKFVFVANRCKVLERTCRGLLDASATANEQALASVSSVAGTQTTPSAAARDGAVAQGTQAISAIRPALEPQQLHEMPSSLAAVSAAATVTTTVASHGLASPVLSPFSRGQLQLQQLPEPNSSPNAFKSPRPQASQDQASRYSRYHDTASPIIPAGESAALPTRRHGGEVQPTRSFVGGGLGAYSPAAPAVPGPYGGRVSPADRSSSLRTRLPVPVPIRPAVVSESPPRSKNVLPHPLPPTDAFLKILRRQKLQAQAR